MTELRKARCEETAALRCHRFHSRRGESDDCGRLKNWLIAKELLITALAPARPRTKSGLPRPFRAEKRRALSARSPRVTARDGC